MRLVRTLVVCGVLFLGHSGSQASSYSLVEFTKITLTDKFWSEAIACGDLDHDGDVDIVVGPYWYEGPGFEKRHVYTSAAQTFELKRPDGSKETIEGYKGALGSGDKVETNEIFLKVVDLNDDGWPDILSVGYSHWSRKPSWFENPGNGERGKNDQWKQHVFADQVDNQSIEFIDLFGDGKPVLIGMYGGWSGRANGRAGYFRPSDPPNREWAFHPISWPADEFQWYTHGLGQGDLNGDGRKDILHSDGWWEQPATTAGDPIWAYHAFPFHLGPGQIKQVIHGDKGMRIPLLSDVSPEGIPRPVTIYGGSQMYVDDINGDGLADVVTSIVAHGYGLAWWEQLKRKDKGDDRQFKRHMIVNKEPRENRYGVKFTEMQAVEFADVDGDGLKDIVTGKRFWGHGKCCIDPESNEAAVLYWFKQVRSSADGTSFIPYLIDNNSGAGTQVVVADVNADGRPDILTANTKGAFVFLQKIRNVSRQEWDRAQPVVLFPDVP